MTYNGKVALLQREGSEALGLHGLTGCRKKGLEVELRKTAT